MRMNLILLSRPATRNLPYSSSIRPRRKSNPYARSPAHETFRRHRSPSLLSPFCPGANEQHSLKTPASLSRTPRSSSRPPAPKSPSSSSKTWSAPPAPPTLPSSARQSPTTRSPSPATISRSPRSTSGASTPPSPLAISRTRSRQNSPKFSAAMFSPTSAASTARTISPASPAAGSRPTTRTLPFVMDASGACANEVKADRALGDRLNIHATPCIFVVTQKKWVHVNDISQLDQIIDTASGRNQRSLNRRAQPHRRARPSLEPDRNPRLLLVRRKAPRLLIFIARETLQQLRVHLVGNRHQRGRQLAQVDPPHVVLDRLEQRHLQRPRLLHQHRRGNPCRRRRAPCCKLAMENSVISPSGCA